MSLVSESQLEQTVRRIQLETNDHLLTEIARLNKEIEELGKTPISAVTASTARPLINQMTRNSDFRFSVDGWFNLISAANNSQFECANVYAYPPLNPISISDAQINAGSNVLQALTSTPFNAGMVGKYAIIEGAGASGERFSARIDSFTNSGQVGLSANASTTVSGASARINLLKLTHKNTKNAPGDTVNDSLKDASHTHYNSNINDPDWKLTDGIGRIGKTNIVGFPFGYFSATDGTTYIPLHQLFAGRMVFARVNIAKANRFVKLKGRLFFGIYNNSEQVLDWVRGGQFTITHLVQGNPATTISAQYQVVIETDSGYSLVSNILTVPDAPDLNAFALGASVKINWNRFAGVKSTTIYRKLGTGNVFALESDTFDREYTDINHPLRQDIGASFPTVINGQDKVFAYFASPENSLDILPNNAAGEPWLPYEAFLAFPPSVNMAQLFDPHLLMGLTEPLATEITDAEANGAGNINSVSAAFNSGMVGKSYILKHLPTNQTATGTVSSYISPTQITLSSSPFAATNCVLEIADSQPNGLLFDLIGTALTEVSSDWTFHPEDNFARQPSVSNPEEGSSQGGIGGSDGYGGGYGGIGGGLTKRDEIEEVLLFY